ncbi:hypothetical protein [Pseudonocardia xishanensis]
MNDPRAGTPRLPQPRPASEPLTSEAVLADDRLIDDVRSGRRGVDDPDPLVRLLSAWRSARRRHRRRPRVGILQCGRRV